MKNQNDPLVLFDVGGVLIKLNFERLANMGAELTHGRLSPKEFLEQYSSSGLEKPYLLGQITSLDLIKGLGKIISEETNLDRLKDLPVSILDNEISDMVELKKELHEKGYQVGVFSNTGELHYQLMSREFPGIYEHADPLVLSFQRHLAKPDKKMYELVGSRPNVIFIDDSKVYVDIGIRDFGWRGIVYQGSIDENEPQRKRDESDIACSDALRFANSSEEVRQHLREFGIK